VTGQPAAAAALNAPPGLATDGAAGGTAAGSCLVRVRLHMTGRGVAECGAALCALADGAACSSSAGEQHPIGFVTAPAVRGACAWAGAGALCDAAALDRCRCASAPQQHCPG
jgi:hypothetical protein